MAIHGKNVAALMAVQWANTLAIGITETIIIAGYVGAVIEFS